LLVEEGISKIHFIHLRFISSWYISIQTDNFMLYVVDFKTVRSVDKSIGHILCSYKHNAMMVKIVLVNIHYMILNDIFVQTVDSPCLHFTQLDHPSLD